MNQAGRGGTSQISRINPVPDSKIASLVSQDTFTDLAEQIMATTADQAAPAERRTEPPAGRARAGRRRLLAAIPVTAAIVVAAVAATVLARPGQKVGPVNIGPASAQALSFTKDGRYIDVIVRNPVADPAIYRAEFAAHHMHITLRLVPVSPSIVGTVVYIGTPSGNTSITTITAKGRCWTGGGGNECPVGVRVPVGFRGQAYFVFGRAARPGEQYESTGSVTSPGEAMHGLHYRGRTVAAVLAMLRARHVTVPQYRPEPGMFCGALPHPVPLSWFVHDADPWAAGQVMLWVAPPAGVSLHCPASAGSTPAPQPSASPGVG